MSKDNDTILVEIASYCDPELLNTVNSAIIQADNPERVHFAICYQSNNLDDYNELKRINNCRVSYMMEEEARGSAYARYLCQHLIEDEKYIFQIDSHMRFVKHWDTKIIEQLEALNDKKAILSAYPAFCTEDMMALPLDDKLYDEPTTGGVMYTNGFRGVDTYFLDCNTLPIEKDDSKAYKRNAFIAAGNFFTYSEAHKEVLHDKEMYFYGDELPMSIRFFTHGWNVYNPPQGFVYHQYERKTQKFPPVVNGMKKEEDRLKALLNVGESNIDLGEFGVGNVRTVKEYEEFSGINFKDKIVHMNAESGDFENPDLKNKISYLQKKNSDNFKDTSDDYFINVVIVDFFNDYKRCVEFCWENKINTKNICFVIATVGDNVSDDEYCNKYNIKKIINFKERIGYTEVLSKLVKNLNKGYAAIVESSFKFIEGWDKYYSKIIRQCGENSALTSWVWTTTDSNNNLVGYNNVIKEFSRFENYLPVLVYNEKIDLSKMFFPYQTPFISDGFLFCKTDVFKKVPIDPNITYEEHCYIYSLRLWTSGINLYYPNVSFLVKLRDESLMNEGIKNYNIICGISGLNNYYSKTLEANYKYDIGSSRPLWGWYEYLGVNYNPIKMEIINDK